MELIILGGLTFISTISLLCNARLTRQKKSLEKELIRSQDKLDRELSKNQQKKHSTLFNPEFENARLRNEIRNLSLYNQQLKYELEKCQLRLEEMLLYRQEKTQPKYNSDVVEAVRKAMIYSHPDKGNCSTSDDFIKYKKLYDNLKGDNKNGKQHY